MENINQEQRDFLKAIDDDEIEIFTFSDIEKNRGIIHPYSDILSSRFIACSPIPLFDIVNAT